MVRLISVRCLHFLIYLFKFSLTLVLAIVVQGTSIQVSEYKAKSPDDARMQCLPPTETVESSNDTYTCRMDATETLVQEMGKTFAILEHIDNSSMTCLNGTTLHRGVMNWERNKTFDTCSYRIKIEAGYYLILSESSNAITFFEKTKCKGNQTCPSESYYSDEIGRYLIM
ncbi:uncharacterized protein LOC130048701 [Ostrea edulis]|uniref:uncharacterized protein LOC130048701 n=1 Tax=Ostrea edulis TaxID=37623 RepID=UPI0024AFDC27|nr:uncharacterized protein LOC130048701 [Ostrea edulis]